MGKKFDFKKLIIVLSAFIVNYIFLYVLSLLKVFNDINKPWSNHLFIIAFFFFGYFLFELFQKEIDFNFAELYVGAILLVLLYFAFFFGYLIYYSQLTGMFSYLITCPYMYIAISFFVGWLAFFFVNIKDK